MDHIAERYVKVVLGVGEHDGDYVDAYYGPAEWRQEVSAQLLSLSALCEQAKGCLDDLSDMTIPAGNQMVLLRHQYLYKQLTAVIAKTEMLQGRKLSFDEESTALYFEI